MDFKSSVFRVIFEGRENYRVMNQQRQSYHAEIAGKLRHTSATLPVIGDWVVGRAQPGEWVLIEEVRERHSVLARKDASQTDMQVLAANVDTLLIVTSANQDLNLNRLDRYVTMALTGRVRPAILVNKIELAPDPHELLDGVAERFPDLDVHGVSVFEGWNLDCLELYARPEQTVALVGSSGVGKSSLTNALLGRCDALTQAIRNDDGRGRHTTTHRQLHVTQGGAFVIDTPGLRQVGLTDDTDLGAAFGDIESLAIQCKFTDCHHAGEPGCAIEHALKAGELDDERWRNYVKLQRELAHVARKADKGLQAEEKRKWAKISLQNRHRGHLNRR